MGAELILASSSPRRRDLLRAANFAFRVHPADVEENAPAELPVAEAVQWNARLKAAWVAEIFPDALVLGVDTLVALDGRPLGKPPDLAAARATLSRLSGRTHEVFSGVCLIQRSTGREVVFTERSVVHFRTVEAEEIDRYFEMVNPLDKAGAYAAQEDPIGLITLLEGSRSNVIGLPMERLKATLARFHELPDLGLGPEPADK